MISVLARGDRVIATARSLEKLESIVSELDAQHADRVRTLQLDVTDGEEKIKTKIDQAITFWKRIDVLVNNAGTYIYLISSSFLYIASLLLSLLLGFGFPGMVEEGG